MGLAAGLRQVMRDYRMRRDVEGAWRRYWRADRRRRDAGAERRGR